MKKRLTMSQRTVLKRVEIGIQRLSLAKDFAAQTRGFSPLTLREIVLLAYYAGRN